MVETKNDELVEHQADDGVEGLDEGDGSGWGDYPLDSVFVRNETRTVSDILKRIDNDRYILDPDFQRDFVWPEDKQSKLIESCVMRIPLPVFYLAEAKDGKIIVVDGLQRLTTFHRFVGGFFRLKGLAGHSEHKDLHALEGKKFGDLALNLQERIMDTQLITYILDAKAPERARLDIFERVNSGVPLTRQQMRNALYNGPATVWMRATAESPLFRQVTGRSLDPKTMRDREALNRFCGFLLLGSENYKGGDMDGFLASTLELMNGLSPDDRKKTAQNLNASLQANQKLFGDHAFRKSLAAGDPWVRRNILNIALWDVCTVLLVKYGNLILEDDDAAMAVREAITELVLDDDFSIAITYSTNSTSAVHTRFAMMEDALEELFE